MHTQTKRKDSGGCMSSQDQVRAFITDPVLQQRLAKYLTLQCVRNSMLEDLHAGISPSSASGDYSDVNVSTPYGAIPWPKVSRLNDDEMKRLMIDVAIGLTALSTPCSMRTLGAKFWSGSPNVILFPSGTNLRLQMPTRRNQTPLCSSGDASGTLQHCHHFQCGLRYEGGQARGIRPLSGNSLT